MNKTTAIALMKTIQRAFGQELLKSKQAKEKLAVSIERATATGMMESLKTNVHYFHKAIELIRMYEHLMYETKAKLELANGYIGDQSVHSFFMYDFIHDCMTSVESLDHKLIEPSDVSMISRLIRTAMLQYTNEI